MSFQREAENLLGEECMKELVNYVRGGKMSDNQLRDFVFQLGEPSDSASNAPNILFGKHTIRMRRDKERELDTELIRVISDWWETSLHAMSRRAALDMLVKALSHPNVYCNPLASNLLSLSKKVAIN